jgi:hypothetical protein
MHLTTRVRTWCVARLYSVQCTVYSFVSETVRNGTHVPTSIQFLFRMTDNTTSQNIDLSSWYILYTVWSDYVGHCVLSEEGLYTTFRRLYPVTAPFNITNR